MIVLMRKITDNDGGGDEDNHQLAGCPQSSPSFCLWSESKHMQEPSSSQEGNPSFNLEEIELLHCGTADQPGVLLTPGEGLGHSWPGWPGGGTLAGARGSSRPGLQKEGE